MVYVKGGMKISYYINIFPLLRFSCSVVSFININTDLTVLSIFCSFTDAPSTHSRTSLLVCCIHGSANTHRSTLAYRIGKSPTSCNYSNTDVIVTTRRSSTMPGRIRSHNALSILIKLNTEQSHVFALRMGLLHCNSNVCVYVRAPGIG